MKNNLNFSDGKTKICVSITGSTEEDIIRDIDNSKEFDYDFIELRIDYFNEVHNIHKVIELLKKIRTVYSNTLLFTLRTKKEGGMYENTDEYYFYLNNFVIESKLVDLIDIEFSHSHEKTKQSIDFAHENNIKVILSSHDFNKTPSKDEILEILLEMQNLNGDITKIAVMANCEQDVLTLMDAALEMKKNKADRPFITISMGALGKITRLFGELLGSCITYVALHKTAAPGQINVKNAREILNILSTK